MISTRRSYKIEEKFFLEEGGLVIGLVASNALERDEWKKRSIEDLKSDFEGRDIQINRLDFKTSILAVEVLNSIADYKNIFLRIENSSKAQDIRLKDEVEII